MKYSFKLCYELDTTLAIAVATYLDCEHYVYLHKGLTKKIEILEHGDGYYKCRLLANAFGFKIGQSMTAQYVPPATFVQYDVEPYPRWLPSIHHLIGTKTTLRYFETPERNTTLSELTIELDLPFWLYPFRQLIRRGIEKVKILKDLEDVAMIDRRAKVFGRANNTAYLNKRQFMLHKTDYLKYFGENSEFYGETSEEYKNLKWTDIKDLDLPYVRRFLAKKYFNYC